MASVETLLTVSNLANCLESAITMLSDRKAIRISGAVDYLTEFEAKVVDNGTPDREVHIIVRGVM